MCHRQYEMKLSLMHNQNDLCNKLHLQILLKLIEHGFVSRQQFVLQSQQFY